ncbi:hypothetical protein ACFVVP_25785 [Streptomyces sp. NPDC058128]|uniref:hypothetical protein n=1 Tax=Streptomyces sp. NPDC058128 TaxID=3346352 RepID=UPI0036E99C33
MKGEATIDKTRIWSAQHPIVVGVIAGLLFTAPFLTVGDLTPGDLLLSFIAFGSLFSLTALNERRRRQKMNRTDN